MPAIHPAAMPAAIPAVNPAIIPDDMPAIIPDNVPAIHPADRAAIIPADMPAVIPAIVRSEAQLLSQEQPLAVDDYVIAVYGKRWYVTELSLENDEVAPTFMTPKRAKWKWGQRDEGVVERTCVLLKVNAPQKDPEKDSSSVLLDILPEERQRAQELYATYTK